MTIETRRGPHEAEMTTERRTTVREIMRREPITIGARASVRELIRTLAREGVGGLPVVDHKERVVGVVSASDVVRLIPKWEREAEAAREPPPEEEPAPAAGGETPATEGGAAGFFRGPEGPLFHLPGVIPRRIPSTLVDRTRVEDIMTPATFSVRPEATVEELARFLLRGGVHRALVFEEGRLVGIATSFDVLRAVAGETTGTE